MNFTRCIQLRPSDNSDEVVVNRHVDSFARKTKNVTWMKEEAKQYEEILDLEAGSCDKYSCVKGFIKT